MSDRVGLVVVAAGSSRRMGGLDKVWARLGDDPVVLHSLRTLAPLVSATVLVVRDDCLGRARDEVDRATLPVRVVTGGRERQESVRNGLEALPPVDTVAVHDAARPFATREILMQGIGLMETYSGAIPVLPLHDTVWRVAHDGPVLETVDRDSLRAVQTPQVFRTSVLMQAHRRAASDGRRGTDEASLVREAGHEITTYPGAPENFKITTEFDLRVARLLVGSAG